MGTGNKEREGGGYVPFSSIHIHGMDVLLLQMRPAHPPRSKEKEGSSGPGMIPRNTNSNKPVLNPISESKPNQGRQINPTPSRHQSTHWQPPTPFANPLPTLCQPFLYPQVPRRRNMPSCCVAEVFGRCDGHARCNGEMQRLFESKCNS